MTILQRTLATVTCALALAHGAKADTVTVAVNGNEGPWSYVNGGLNTNSQYGVGDQAAPTVVGAGSGLSFAAGGSFTITYLSGTTSAGGGFPSVDGRGDTAFLANDGTGSSGRVFPSFYFNHADYPVYLSELVGTFASSTGAIVGTPFAIGNGRTVVAPTGAAELLLGFNDDIFSDNTGALTVSVSGPAVSAVPEPSAMALAGVGLALAVLARRKGRERA